MSCTRLVSTVSVASGENHRTLEKFGVRHKLRRNVPEDDPLTVIDCPCCGGTVVLAWNHSEDLPEFGECRRCETEFPYSLDEVYESDLLDVAVAAPRTYSPAA